LKNHSKNCVLPIIFTPNVIFNLLKGSTAFFLKQHPIQTSSAIKSGIFWECQYHTHVLNKMALNNHSAIANTASTIWFSKLHSMHAWWQKVMLVEVMPSHGQSRNYLIIPSILQQSFY